MAAIVEAHIDEDKKEDDARSDAGHHLLHESDHAEILAALFGLKDQKLINDFSCAISEKLVLHGRMYITEDAVCFYSNVFGKETKKILPFDRMKCILKKNAAYVFPALEFVMQPRAGGEKRVMFTSFLNKYRDDCHKLCVDLHQKHRPEGYEEPAAASASSTVDIALIPQTSNSPPTTVESPRKRANSLPIPRIAQLEAVKSAEAAVEYSEAQRSPKVLVQSTSRDSSVSHTGTTCSIDSAEDKTKEHVGTLPTLPDSIWKQLASMKVICNAQFAIPPDDFFHTFLADDAKLSIPDIHRAVGHFDVHCSPWADISTSSRVRLSSGDLAEHTDERDAPLARSIRLVMPLEPAPFTPKQTSVEKSQTLYKFADHVYVVQTSARSHDVPYSDYFVTEDIWLILPAEHPVPITTLPEGEFIGSPGPTAQSCRLIVGVFVNFSKGTIFRSKITTKAEEGALLFYGSALTQMKDHLTGPAKVTDSSDAAGKETPCEFLSPSRAATAAKLKLRTPRDEIMATWISPQHASTVPVEQLLRQYSQLFAAHEVMLGQVRRMRDVSISEQNAPSPVTSQLDEATKRFAGRPININADSVLLATFAISVLSLLLLLHLAFGAR